MDKHSTTANLTHKKTKNPIPSKQGFVQAALSDIDVKFSQDLESGFHCTTFNVQAFSREKTFDDGCMVVETEYCECKSHRPGQYLNGPAAQLVAWVLMYGR